MAPQLTATKGRARRSPLPWIARAINSLPTPERPSTSTGMAEPAAFSACRSTACMRWLRVMMSLKVSVPEWLRLMRWISLSSALVASALRRLTSRRSAPTGLTTKSVAPARIADTTLSMPPCAVCTITGMVSAGVADAGEHAEAVEIGHHQVEHHRVDLAGVGAGQHRGRRVAAFGDDDVIAVAREHALKEAALHRIVVDNENPLDHVRTHTH